MSISVVVCASNATHIQASAIARSGSTILGSIISQTTCFTPDSTNAANTATRRFVTATSVVTRFYVVPFSTLPPALQTQAKQTAETPDATREQQTAEAAGTQTAEAEGTQTAEAEGTETAVQQTADANATRDKQTADANATRDKQTADANATRDRQTAEAQGTINAEIQATLDAQATIARATDDARATIARATDDFLATQRALRGNGDSGGGSSGRREAATPDPANQPIPTQDHSRLPAGAEIESDTDWIAFSEVSGAAISNPDVRAAALSAIDVWGPLGVDAEVCFAGYGSLLLLDTAYSPRRLVWLTSYLRPDGKVCAQVNRAGTVVLMPGAPSATLTPSPRPAGLPPPPTANPYLIRDNPATARALSNCMVTSIDLLNFRASPAGPIKSWYAGNAMALSRTRNWFQVSYLGNVGWISAHFVTTTGDCA